MKTARSVRAYCGIALATLLLLIATYSGTYYAVVRPTPYLVDMSSIGSHPVWITFPKYPRIAGNNCEPVFRPMHWLDRRLRPATWKSP